MSQRLSLTQAFVFLLRRDLLLALRNRAEYAMPLLFFVLVITLFPLALGALPELLARIAPGIIWVAALLAAMLSLDSIFRSDFDDGSLEQILLSAHPVAVLVLAKVSAHWLVTGLPLLLVAPLLAEMLGMPSEAQPTLLLTILIGTPILSLIGAIGVALTVGLRKGGIILFTSGVAPVCAGFNFCGERNRKCRDGIRGVCADLHATGFSVSVDLTVALGHSRSPKNVSRLSR